LNPQKFLKIAYKDPHEDIVNGIVLDSNRMVIELVNATDKASKGNLDKNSLVNAVRIAIGARNKIKSQMMKMESRGDDKRYFKSYEKLEAIQKRLDSVINIATRVIIEMNKMTKVYSTPAEYNRFMAKSDMETNKDLGYMSLKLAMKNLQKRFKELRPYPKRILYDKLMADTTNMIETLKQRVEKLKDLKYDDTNPDIYADFEDMLNDASVLKYNLSRVTPRKFY
jgi:hypothetical protein